MGRMYRLFSLLIGFLLSASIQPIFSKDKEPNWEGGRFCFIEVRAADFVPTGHSFQSIYSSGGLLGVEFDCRICKQLYGWVGASYWRNKGRAEPDRTASYCTIVPINAGLKWIYSIYQVQPYLGVGVEYSYGHEETNSPYLAHSRLGWGWGGVFKTGFLVYFANHFLLDFYADYSLRALQLNDFSASSPHLELIDSVNLSGFTFGGGLGYGF